MKLKMDIQLTARVIVPDGVLIQEIDGESVLLNINNENYYGLDEVGTKMWKILKEAPSISQAIELLLDEYDVKRTTLIVDVKKFVGLLVEKKLMELC